MATGQCPNCNTPNDYSAVHCTMCGTRLPWAPPQMPPAGFQPQAPAQATCNADNPSLGMAILGFLIPIAGLILFLVGNNKTPLRARSAGKGALWGFGIGTVVIFILFTLGGKVQNLPTAQGSSLSSGEMRLRQESDLSSIKQIGLLAALYMDAHDGNFADYSSTASAVADLTPYLAKANESSDIFTDSNGQPFLFNPAMAHKSVTIDNPSSTVLIYQTPRSDNDFAVGYVDGHARMTSPQQWPALAAASGITNQ